MCDCNIDVTSLCSNRGKEISKENWDDSIKTERCKMHGGGTNNVYTCK
jgi:hypothetical protein